MYSNFYGMSERPFEITPDPKFLYLTPSSREILASLIYGIRERRGFATMVGEPGTGKTTLIRSLLDWLDKKVRVAFIFNTDVTFEEMLNMALLDLGLANPEESLSKVNALKRLSDFAIQQSTKGGNVAFIVDEAQNLDRRALENLRLLSNMETRKHKLIQIVLSGQPELEEKLNHPELRQLVQRISLKRYVTPLPEKETLEYIQHRLAIANCDDPDLFNVRAKQLIWQYSGGVPRKINILCDNALLTAYGLKIKQIKGHIVEETIKGLNWSSFSDSTETHTMAPTEKKGSPPWYASSKGLLIAACFILMLGILIGAFWLK